MSFTRQKETLLQWYDTFLTEILIYDAALEFCTSNKKSNFAAFPPKKTHQKLQKKVCELNLFNLILFYLMRSRQVMHKDCRSCLGQFYLVWEGTESGSARNIYVTKVKRLFFCSFFWPIHKCTSAGCFTVKEEPCRSFQSLSGRRLQNFLPLVYLWPREPHCSTRPLGNEPSFFLILYAKWRKLWRHPQGNCVLDKQKSY